MVLLCFDRDACIKIVSNMNSRKTYRCTNTGFHKLNKPLVGCCYDLVQKHRAGYLVPDNRQGDRSEGDLHFNLNQKSLASPWSS